VELTEFRKKNSLPTKGLALGFAHPDSLPLLFISGCEGIIEKKGMQTYVRFQHG
jgi:hypothetical protein